MNVKLLALVATGLLLAGCATTETEDLAETPIAPMLTEMQEEVEATTDSDPGYATPEEMEEAEEPAAEAEPETKTEATADTATETEPEPTTEPDVEETPEAAASETPEPEPTASGYTMQMIAANNTVSKCWAVIDGMAYDLTNWISSHPGGSSAIANLCGKDGTSRFLSQHGGQASPDRALDGYLLGPITG